MLHAAIGIGRAATSATNAARPIPPARRRRQVRATAPHCEAALGWPRGPPEAPSTRGAVRPQHCPCRTAHLTYACAPLAGTTGKMDQRLNQAAGLDVRGYGTAGRDAKRTGEAGGFREFDNEVRSGTTAGTTAGTVLALPPPPALPQALPLTLLLA